jgi:transcription initiation factor TFIIH subunit 4
MSLLYVETPISTQDLQYWVNKDGQRYQEKTIVTSVELMFPTTDRKLSEALLKLSRLRILEENGDLLVMNDTFRLEFQNALTGG